jgi:Tol biopolymer transport system component
MTDLLDSLRAALSDRYRLDRELGQGGMATVYLAEDLKHHRQVAIKVLRPELAALLGAERFLKEIETTANLQHPHILPLFDSGEAGTRGRGEGTFLFYVMPFVPGESLRERLARDGELPVADAVRIARAVVSALGAAHRRGIVHRDIKPENILLADGEPVVADFGIARAISASAGDRLTSTGLAVGTPAYMSPEQASADSRIDGRTDLYSLGAVLYEMLAGEQPFRGRTAEAITARKMTEDAPALHSVRPAVPEALEQVVRKALARTAGDRFQTAEEFIGALEQVALTESGATRRVPVTPRRWVRWAPWAIAAGLAGVSFWAWLRPPPRQAVIRQLSAQAEGEEFVAGGESVRLAISPDGRRMVYVGPPDSAEQLWLRDWTQLHATPIPGTRGGTTPVFSPDGEQLAYLDGQDVRVSRLDGSPPVTIVDSAGTFDWSDDGHIYYITYRGVMRVPAQGGARELVLPRDTASGQLGWAWPEALPGWRGILFRSYRSADHDSYEIMLGVPESGELRPLAKGVFARYANSGHLLIVTPERTLLAAPFDLRRLALTGPAVPLVDSVGIKNLGAVDIAVSRTGRLVYSPSSGEAPARGVPVWVERGGRETPVELDWTVGLSFAGGLALSPDGGTLALAVPEAAGRRQLDIWLKKLPAGPMTRLTAQPPGSYQPFWSPDGKMVGFTSARLAGLNSLWQRPANGSGDDDSLLAVGGVNIWRGAWSPDGRWLLASGPLATRGNDIIATRPGHDSTPVALVNSALLPSLSPDGRWLAYSAREAGRREVYVRPFHEVSTGKWRISLDGGDYPKWSRQGDQLFYVAVRNAEIFMPASGDVMVARVRTSPTFEVVDRSVFAPALRGEDRYYWDFEVSPDGSRLLMVRLLLQEQRMRRRLVVVDNFFEELKAKVPR